MAQDHIVRAFDEELENIRTAILQMGGLVEAQIEDALKGVTTGNQALAKRCVETDKRVDARESELDGLALRVLALRQPVAADLRLIVGALKVAGELERVGDLASNIAKRASLLAELPQDTALEGIRRMGNLTLAVLREVLDAYAKSDVERGLAAWRRDSDIDDMYNSLFREFLTYMVEDPATITPHTHLLFIAKNFERIGDHATNIAELLYFQETGIRLANERPKGDMTSFTTPAGVDVAAVSSVSPSI